MYLVAMPFRRRLTLLVVGAIALLAPLAHARREPPLHPPALVVQHTRPSDRLRLR